MSLREIWSELQCVADCQRGFHYVVIFPLQTRKGEVTVPVLVLDLQTVQQCLFSIVKSLLAPERFPQCHQSGRTVWFDFQSALKRSLRLIPLSKIHVRRAQQQVRFKEVWIS